MTFKILIVGGGIGGLAIAHAIRRAIREGRISSVEVTVYEQREDESAMQQYPVHLNQDGRDALRGILSEGDYEEMVLLANQGTEHGGISISTPKLKPLFKMRQYENQQPQFIHRWLLKEILGKGVTIKRGRKIMSVQEPVGDADKTKVVFDDGSSETADLVVGADGVGSATRRQKYPSHAQFERLPYLNIQMKLSTDSSRLPNLLDDHGFNTVLGAANYSLLLVPFHRPAPTAASVQLTINTANGDTTKSQYALDLSGDTTEPYLFAILTIRAFNGWQDLTSTEWGEKVFRLLEADHADKDLIHAFMEDIIPDTIGEPWQAVRCDPSNSVPYDGGRVVLIGDAAHAMPPQAGAGASTALMGAHRLSRIILSYQELDGKGVVLLDMLPAFHEEMMSRANRLVKDATRRLYLSNRSGLGVRTQRATLRLMNVLWPAVERFSGKPAR